MWSALAHPGQFGPLGGVVHQVLQLANALERVQTLVQQECRVVHQHVHKLHPRLPRTKQTKKTTPQFQISLPCETRRLCEKAEVADRNVRNK